MKMKLNNYIKLLENKIKDNDIENGFSESVLTWISFFQHERLVHLIVTFMTAVGMILFLLGFMVTNNIFMFFLFVITVLLFVAYILHYYYLENGVQKLYGLYDEIKKKD